MSKVSLYKANDSKAVTSQVFFPGIIPWLHLKDKLAIGVPVGAVELKVTFHQNIKISGVVAGVYISPLQLLITDNSNVTGVYFKQCCVY